MLRERKKFHAKIITMAAPLATNGGTKVINIAIIPVEIIKPRTLAVRKRLNFLRDRSSIELPKVQVLLKMKLVTIPTE